MKNKIYWIIFALFSILLVACQPKALESDETSQELKKFSSADEIKEFLQENTQKDYFARGPVFALASDSSAESAVAVKTTGAADFSETNVQVKGVDEADFVKNDGKYIYTLTQNKLVVIDAFPAEDAEILSTTELDGFPRNMFVNDDRLVVFVDDDEEIFMIPEYDFVPRPRRAAITHALVYDISDRENPELVSDFNLKGNYFDARMIENDVYFIVKENVYFFDDIIDLPVIKEASTTVVKPDVFYFDNPENNYNFHTIASFDIFKDDIEAKSFMLGHTNNLFVSKNSIYITYPKNLPFRHYGEQNQERFYEVVVPLLPSKIQRQINDVKGGSLNSNEKWEKISEILQDMYNSMDEDEKENLIEEIDEAIEEYDLAQESERRKTVIHKININRGRIDYDTRGEVPGFVLNQFSMDEYDNHFRVATTTELYTRKEFTMFNNVFVLDDNLKVVGSIEEIAPDERIFSARFIGERLYMVTFKRIDPLFVIDLSDPENPEILGELKIPGFSDYLHPYDENHIIGIGKETKSNEWGGVSTRGVKLSLFDVSDVENPKQLDKYEIGEQGTDSEALREHKAFLFDREKNILVIPVREVQGKRYYDGRLGYYRQNVRQGAYVFGLTPETGFELKGTITHSEEDEDSSLYYGSPNAVRRSLYMDDVLYTVSAAKIKANNIESIEELNEIALPYEEPYYPRPIPFAEPRILEIAE